METVPVLLPRDYSSIYQRQVHQQLQLWFKKQNKEGFTVLVRVALIKTFEGCFLWREGGKKGRLSDTPATCFLRFPNKEAAITMPWCAVLTQRRSREEPQNGRCLVPLTGINYCAWNRKKALTLWQHWHGLLLTSESSQADAGVSKTDERTLIFTEIWDVIQLCEALHKPVDIWTVLNRVNWITFHVKQFCFNYPSRYSRCSRKNEHFDSMWMNLLSKRGVKNQLQPGDQ